MNPNGLIDYVKMFFGFDTKYQKDVKVDLQQLKKDDKGVANIITELEVGLSHELQHSFDVDKKLATYETTENGIKLMEVRAVNTENKIRRKTGDPKRIEYGGKKIPKKLLE